MNLIQFESIDWEQVGVGVRQKVFVQNNQRLRLLEFCEGFIEKDWCLKAHSGYVLEGEMEIDFGNMVVKFRRGDGLWIEKEEKHKVCIEDNKKVKLILFEFLD